MTTARRILPRKLKMPSNARKTNNEKHPLYTIWNLLLLKLKKSLDNSWPKLLMQMKKYSPSSSAILNPLLLPLLLKSRN